MRETVVDGQSSKAEENSMMFERVSARVMLHCVALSCLATATVANPASAQTDGTCVNVAERAGRELGCFITARQELGQLGTDSSWFWHLDNFPSRTEAESAKGPRAVVVESLGRVWLFTIADSAWQSGSGNRVATIGPLPLLEAVSYAAVYMEGVFRPGMASQVHRHPGPEAWYTLSGMMCLEWPTGTATQRAGEHGLVIPGGIPMVLTGTGTETRRSVVLILQDSAEPRSTPAHDWTPRGLCSS
jgi:hypothetical protein